MKIISLSLVFLLFGSFLYLSKAQGIRFFDSTRHPVDGLIVTVHEISSGKDKIYITDQKGAVSLNELNLPVTVRTFHFAFQAYTDTLSSLEPKTITLKTNNVNVKEVSITGNYGLTDHSLYNTEVISREQIDSRAANNITDLFVHQLNTRIANDPSTGSSVSIQGIGGENIKILVDGVPVIGRLYNNINPSQLNLNNASRVEIIKGPASVLYGTNALGGVINIITDAGTKENFRLGLNSYYESTGQYNADVFSNFNFKKTSLSVSGGRNFFQGWSEHDTSRAVEWKPKEQYFGNVRVSHRFKNTTAIFQTSLFNEDLIAKSGTLRGWPYEAYVFDEYYRTLRFNNQLQLNHIVDATHSLQIVAAYSYYRYMHNTYRKDLLTLSQTMSTQNDTTEFGAEMLRIVYTKDNEKSWLNYQAGIDVNQENSTGKRIKDTKQKVGDYAAFTSLQFKPLAKLIISPAIRIAYNNTYNAPIVSSIQTIYSMNQNTIVRASYSRGFRAPSLKEMYLQFDFNNHNVFGNPKLAAENSHHILASIDLKKTIGRYNLKFTPSLFYNEINNKISLASQGDKYTYINLLKYITRGGQLSTNFNYGQLRLNAGISYTGIYNELENNIADIPFTYSTELNSAIEYTFIKTGTNLAAYWKYNGRQPVYFLDENNVPQLFNGESYSMFDISLVQSLLKKKLTVGAGVKNILNVTSIKSYRQSGAHQANDDYALTSMGRSVFVRIQLQLSK